MKPRTLVSILLFTLVVLIVIGSCVTGKKAYVAKEHEEIYGTWVNPEYNYSGYATPKFIYHPDGKSEGYTLDTDTHIRNYGEFIITNKWIDSEGNYWYKVEAQTDVGARTFYHLWKIDNSGTTWEYRYDLRDFPTTMDTTFNYAIRYRYEECYGTWIGAAEKNPAKMILNPDGTDEKYLLESSVEPGRTVTFTIIDKLNGFDGNI